jgi:two-component system, response regulator YesN
MFNLLIVDDEQVIREGLRTLIPWEKYGFSLRHVAINGKDALEKYKEANEPIHLMFIDIKMPGIDGLQVIEKIREMDKLILFVVISGHADFTYAKKAMAWGVEDYIVKPIDEEELLECVIKLRKKLQKSEELQWLVDQNIDTHCETFITSLIMSANLPVDEDSLVKIAKNLGLLWSSYQLLFIEDQYESQDQIQKKSLLVEMIEGKKRGFVFSKVSGFGILLNKDRAENHNLTYLYRDLSKVLDMDCFRLAAGVVVTDISKIRESYQSVKMLLEHQFFYSKKLIIGPDTERLEQCQCHYEVVEESEFINKLLYAIEIGNINVINKFIETEMFCYVKGDSSETAIKKNSIQLISTIYNQLLKNDVELTNLEDNYSKWIVDIYKQHNYELLTDYIKAVFREIITQLDTDSSSVIMKKLFNLIDLNYSKNIKLETLAEVFNYSSGYLGKLFKNTTGEYFNTYLDKVRIEKAKKLLEQGHKVYQVAENVGYTNVDYFYSKFKKYVGMSPSSYKKM